MTSDATVPPAAATTVETPEVGAPGAVDQEARIRRELRRLEDRFPRYPTGWIAVLMWIGIIDAADRGSLTIVFEDVKQAFGVSDTQLGLLTGAYSVLAALSVLPFGVVIDKWSRVRLLMLGLIPWSVAMAATGAAQSFVMMFGARLFLASIEATNGPAMPSLIGDYYPVDRRSRIFGLVGMAEVAGTLVGFVLMGAVATLAGWRTGFFVWGVLGLMTAGLVAKVLREPERGLPDAIHRVKERLARLHTAAAGVTVGPDDDGDGELAADEVPTELRLGRARRLRVLEQRNFDYRTIGTRDFLRVAFSIPTVWITVFATAVGWFAMSGISTWAPTFFRRYHGMSALTAAATTALLGMSAVVGYLVGGRIGDRVGLAGRVRLSAAATVAAAFGLALAFSIDSTVASVPVFVVSGLLVTMPEAPLRAVRLDCIIPHMRGRVEAMRSIFRVVGTAAAPVLFGVFSDRYGLRSAFILVMPALILNGFILLFARRTYAPDRAFVLWESLKQVRREDGDR